MYNSESLTNIAKALSSFQSKVGTIDKNKNVKFNNVKYTYADQASIFNGIKGILGECELSYSQIIADNGTKLVTLLMHSSGEWIKSEIALMMSGDIKMYGSDVTYKRRYALSAILGLATEDDTDGDNAPIQQSPQEVVKAKPELTQKSKAWANAIKSYQEKGNLDAVKEHANISPENEKLIIEAANTQSKEKQGPY